MNTKTSNKLNQNSKRVGNNMERLKLTPQIEGFFIAVTLRNNGYQEATGSANPQILPAKIVASKYSNLPVIPGNN